MFGQKIKIMKGRIRNIDTSSFKKGTKLYLDTEKPGALTTQKQVRNFHDAVIALRDQIFKLFRIEEIIKWLSEVWKKD